MEHAEEPVAAAAAFQTMFADPDRLRAWLAHALPVVQAFVFARCGANQSVAEDITQETMVEVVKHRTEFDGRAAPTTWVCGIARHKIADHYRAQYREERGRLRVLQEVVDTDRRQGAVDETTDAVVDVLHRLPEAQRVVLALHYLDGLPVRDIAPLIGRGESAVESLLARGRETFRRTWHDRQGRAT